MSTLPTILAPVAGAVAHSTTPAQTRPTTGSTQSAVISNAVVSGQAAAVVNITSRSSGGRAVSHGENRKTDSTFEKEGTKESDGKGKGTGATKAGAKSVDVSA